MVDVRLPNLLVPGTQKGGTTSIYRILASHPDIFMSANKEPGLFHNRSEITPEELAVYAEHFSNAPPGVKYIGEATAHYFWEKLPVAPSQGKSWKAMSNTPLIRSTLPSRLFVVLTLRHPVERAISAYHHNFTRGRVGPDEGILTAAKRSSMGIIDLGFYRRHLEGWRNGLPEARFFLTTTDELKKVPVDVYTRLVQWLDLPYSEIPHEVLTKRWNSKSAMRKQRRSTESFPEVTAREREALEYIYADEISYWAETLPGARDWIGRS